MSGDHGPGALSAAGRHRRPLVIALGLTASFLLVEVAVGLIVGSLALLSDAGHMLTDVAGLTMALAAIEISQRLRGPSHTYGLYRLEVLAALANAVLLFAIAGYVLYEGIRRFSDPPDVAGTPVLVVAVIGLAVNMTALWLLRRGAAESLNVRGAYLEVLSDLLGSAGVILAGVVLLLTGWPYVDPIVGVAIGLFILPRAWRVGREALRILLEVAPEDLDVDAVRLRLERQPGIANVHDLHIWTVTSGLRAASGHLMLDRDADLEEVLRRATEMLEHDFSIEHVTLQCEPAGFREPRPAI